MPKSRRLRNKALTAKRASNASVRCESMRGDVPWDVLRQSSACATESAHG